MVTPKGRPMEQLESEETQAAAVAIASLPLMGPIRMSALVRRFGFQQAWQKLQNVSWTRYAGVARAVGPQAANLAEAWASAARDIVPEVLYQHHLRAGVDIIPLGSPRFPPSIALDIEPPMVVFARGNIHFTQATSVGIVGTRAATTFGNQIAYELADLLATAGINIVSGLALGIDGAAHRGVLAGSAGRVSPGAPIGVVASGLDVVYPKAHNKLWQQVAERGVLLSEWPLGTVAQKWHFPARNRLIAALSKILVVVESHERGGSLLTAEEALKRDRLVMAVPGSIRSPASSGSNRLIADGMTPICQLDDVLVALGLSGAVEVPPSDPSNTGPTHDSSSVAGLDQGDAALLDHLGWQPVMLDELAERAELSLAELSLRLTLLETKGLITRSASAIERVR